MKKKSTEKNDNKSQRPRFTSKMPSEKKEKYFIHAVFFCFGGSGFQTVLFFFGGKKLWEVHPRTDEPTTAPHWDDPPSEKITFFLNQCLKALQTCTMLHEVTKKNSKAPVNRTGREHHERKYQPTTIQNQNMLAAHSIPTTKKNTHISGFFSHVTRHAAFGSSPTFASSSLWICWSQHATPPLRTFPAERARNSAPNDT